MRGWAKKNNYKILPKPHLFSFVDLGRMRHSTKEEQECYDRMLDRLSVPLGFDIFNLKEK